MYQEIDSQDEEETAASSGGSILPILLGTLLAGLVFLMVWLFLPAQSTAPGQVIDTPASRAAYLKALSEPNPALRRARLLDFQRVYPETDRRLSIESQLDVINTAELADWESLSDVVFDETLKQGDKRNAMTAYETRWNGQILGGRGEELIELQKIIENSKPEDTLPNRVMDPGESPIPDDTPADILAGAPPKIIIPLPIPPPPPPPAPVVELPKDIIVEPTIRKKSTPKYPRSARKRKIGAFVTVSMMIDEEGKVQEARIIDIQAERYVKDFAKAAKRAAEKTKYNPKTINGRPVPSVERREYIFRVEE